MHRRLAVPWTAVEWARPRGLPSSQSRGHCSAAAPRAPLCLWQPAATRGGKTAAGRAPGEAGAGGGTGLPTLGRTMRTEPRRPRARGASESAGERLLLETRGRCDACSVQTSGSGRRTGQQGAPRGQREPQRCPQSFKVYFLGIKTFPLIQGHKRGKYNCCLRIYF